MKELTNIELFGNYIGQKYIDNGWELFNGYNVKVLKLLKAQYKITRRKYLMLYRSLEVFKNYDGKCLETRHDYHALMGLDYMYGTFSPDSRLNNYSPISRPKEHDFQYVLARISPEYCKSLMRACEIELCFLKRNMRSIRTTLRSHRDDKSEDLI